MGYKYKVVINPHIYEADLSEKEAAKLIEAVKKNGNLSTHETRKDFFRVVSFILTIILVIAFICALMAIYPKGW